MVLRAIGFSTEGAVGHGNVPTKPGPPAPAPRIWRELAIRRYKMNCEEANRSLDAYLDRELDLLRNLELEIHSPLVDPEESQVGAAYGITGADKQDGDDDG